MGSKTKDAGSSASKNESGSDAAGTAAREPLRSRITVEGADRAPHRTFLRAMGLDDEAIAKPFVGVMSTHGENTPCSLSLRPQAEAAKMGVAMAGGTPFEFTTVSVSDGVSMNHRGMRMSLMSRELIADSIELVMRGHAYDALVGFAGCDKTLPGIMMAMVRLNCPSVFMYGGAMLPGEFQGKPVSTNAIAPTPSQMPMAACMLFHSGRPLSASWGLNSMRLPFCARGHMAIPVAIMTKVQHAASSMISSPGLPSKSFRCSMRVTCMKRSATLKVPSMVPS